MSIKKGEQKTIQGIHRGGFFNRKAIYSSSNMVWDKTYKQRGYMARCKLVSEREGYRARTLQNQASKFYSNSISFGDEGC
jgi:hypothetical protein